jgi:hypothetical protein
MSKRRSIAAKRRQRQTEGAPPVVENAAAPRMGESEPQPAKIGGRLRYMPDHPPADEGRRNRMPPARKIKSVGRSTRTLPDQALGRPKRGEETSGGAGYVRLRLRVEDGKLALAGAKFVEGPLVQSEMLHHGLAYEVTLGKQRLAVGGVPDPGVWRSFPDPQGRPAMEGHHITSVPTYEIAVRIPAEKLSVSALPRTRITLYRWEGADHSAPLGAQPLKSQFKRGLREVSALKGIRPNRLEKRVQAELRRALR